MNKVSVIIPAYNEESHIAKTLKSLKEINEVTEIIVVDDGSKDNTSILARENGAIVITLPHNEGKGGAMSAGLKVAKEEIIAFLDADLGSSAGEVKKLINALYDKNADLVIADWSENKNKKGGGFGLALGLARWGIKHLTGFNAMSPLSGQRVIKKKYLNQHFERGFGVEVGMTVDSLRKGAKVIEVPVNMNHRETSRDLKGFSHRGKQFYSVGKFIIKKKIEVYLWK